MESVEPHHRSPAALSASLGSSLRTEGSRKGASSREAERGVGAGQAVQ